MVKDTKLGTFGGVFTPSVLTILGVIMYLRLPWVMGHAGLWLGLGIIAAAHVVSVTTGLSISSIATDKKVGAGGAYYIISRSLGLPIGGTIGLALFLGFSLSISFYIVGFSESLLTYLGIGLDPKTGAPTIGALRICGTITLFALTIITFISTALAIKTQYLILALIALSLVSIGLGHPAVGAASSTPATAAPAQPLGVLFAIFFPAVTGFTAGVNMSGDLRDPNRAIPRGTMLAIFTGLVVYVGLAVFLSLRVPRQQLLDNPQVLLDIALSPQLVVAGIWGATLSSALGSILGAPRILQALAADRIGPPWFIKGHGPTNEPRRALLVAFLIGLGGILIAELDAIAGIVSMVFLATYGFLNVCCAIEMWASPDFRPAFRIPSAVSVVGTVACVVLMIQIDLPAMIGATVMLAALFFYLRRRQLVLESGDTWEGIWSTLVQSGLQRLTRVVPHHRNWRPNIALFSLGEQPAAEEALASLRLGAAVARSGGLLTHFVLVPKAAGGSAKPAAEAVAEAPGVFERRVDTDDPYRELLAICRHHGFAGLAPNTVMLCWHEHADASGALARLLDELSALDLNVLLHAVSAKPAEPASRIDLWWTFDRGNIAFSVALLRFLTAQHEWRQHDVRALLFDDGRIEADVAFTSTRELLRGARLTAQVQIVRGGLRTGSFEQAVLEESAEAALVLLGLPPSLAEGDEPAGLSAVAQLAAGLRRLLLYRASTTFAPLGGLARTAVTAPASARAEATEEEQLGELRLPGSAELARQVSSFDQQHRVLIRRFADEGLAKAWQLTFKLLDALSGVIAKQLSQLGRAAGSEAGPRRAKTIARIERTVLFQCQRLIREFNRDGLPAQQAILERATDAYLMKVMAIAASAPSSLAVQRPAADFAPAPDDTRYIARFKSWARLRARLSGGQAAYHVPVRPALTYMVHQGAASLRSDGMQRLAVQSQSTAIELGRVLSSLQAVLSSFRAEQARQVDAGRVDAEQVRVAGELLALRVRIEEHHSEQRLLLLQRSRQLAQALADHLSRLDIQRRVRLELRPTSKSRGEQGALRAAARSWQSQHRLLFEQAELKLMIAGFQHRIRAITERLGRTLAGQVAGGVLRNVEQLKESLARLLEAVQQGQRVELIKLPELHASLDRQRIVDEVVEDTQQALLELPESVAGLPDESLAKLEVGRIEETAVVTIPLRRLVQFLLESQLISALQEELTRVSAAERRAIAAAEEVVRLCHFHWGDLHHPADDAAPHEGLRSVLEDGLTRLATEREQLQPLAGELLAELARLLDTFLRSVEPRSLLSSLEQFEQRVRYREGRRAWAGLRRVEGEAATRVSRFVSRLLYRRSTGVLAARRLSSRGSPPRTEVGALAHFVNRLSPKAAVLAELPFYYQQLFLAQTAINESFWVGRQKELEQAARAVEHFRAGTHGSLIITGEIGSGKTALCGVLAGRLFEPQSSFRVLAPRGGSTDPRALQAGLERATGLQGDGDAILRALPRGSLIVLDDLELWWERSPEGLGVLEELSRLIDRHADRLMFLLSLSCHIHRLVEPLLRLSDQALTTIECSAVDAEALMRIVMLRHRATGRVFAYRGRTEQQLSEWRLARLFNRYFQYSRGNVGAALSAWIAHIDELSEGTLVIRRPQVPTLELLHGLGDTRLALLLELCLHKQTSHAGLERILSADGSRVRAWLDPLLRSGLVKDSPQGGIELNRHARPWVTEALRQRGWLS